MSDKLKNRDYILLIDKSGSMSQPGTHGTSRWKEAQETTEALARKAAEFDPDGITVIPFARTYKVYEGVTPDKVNQVFAENEPNGGTDTAKALQVAFDLKKDKPITVLVITDGIPDDEEAVKRVIREFAAKQTDNGQGDTDDVGILFVQIGDDKAATKFLVDLDDNLNAKFDIVDVKTADQLESISLTDALLEALEG